MLIRERKTELRSVCRSSRSNPFRSGGLHWQLLAWPSEVRRSVVSTSPSMRGRPRTWWSMPGPLASVISMSRRCTVTVQPSEPWGGPGHPPRDEFVLSTKVGRLVREAGDVRADDEVDLQALGDQRDAFYPGTDGRRVVFDYSADGVRRSTSSTSTTRTGIGESRPTRRIPHSRDCGPTESSERSAPA